MVASTAVDRPAFRPPHEQRLNAPICRAAVVPTANDAVSLGQSFADGIPCASVNVVDAERG